MQHHHSRVSRSLQPTIDSLPSISDLSLNLISFSPPTSPEYDYGPVHSYVFEWLRVFAPHVGFPAKAFFFSTLSRVNSAPNQVFIIIIVILRHLIVNHTLSRPVFVGAQRCNDKASSANTVWMWAQACWWAAAVWFLLPLWLPRSRLRLLGCRV